MQAQTEEWKSEEIVLGSKQMTQHSFAVWVYVASSPSRLLFPDIFFRVLSPIILASRTQSAFYIAYRMLKSDLPSTATAS